MIQHEGNGLLAVNDNVASYITNLERVIEDQTFRERLGVVARQTIEDRYTDIHIARQSLAYYAQGAGQGIVTAGEVIAGDRLGEKFAE